MSAGSPVSLRTACSSGMTPRSRTHVPSRSVGSGASHSWSTCAPASESPSATWSWVSRWATASTSSLAMYARKRVARSSATDSSHITSSGPDAALDRRGPPRADPAAPGSACDSETSNVSQRGFIGELSRSAAARARQSASRYAAIRASRSRCISSPKTSPVLRLYGSASVNCMVSGRGVTCGQTWAPSARPCLVQPDRFEVPAAGRREQRVGEGPPDARLPRRRRRRRCTALPGVMSTTPLPASPAARNSASTSSASAKRLGTGLPSTPRCAYEKLVENPAAPASIPSRTSAAHAARSRRSWRRARRRRRPSRRAAVPSARCRP